MTRSFLALLALLMSATALAQPSDRWLRDPAISPDGRTLAFTHGGDIHRVPATGGMAVALTRTDAVESNPRWSPDGQRIAYSSDRNGTLDVYVLDLADGAVRRLTFHEANDVVTGFTADGREVLFESVRYEPPGLAADPQRSRPELYAVPVDGGTPRQVTPIEARQAVPDADGNRLLYSDYKGDQPYRKHDDSPFARDVWLLDRSVDHDNGRHEQLTTSRWNDHSPAWDADGAGFHFISERSGSLNVWHQSFDRGEESATQVTFHETHPVRGLGIASDGTLVYGFDGEIYRIEAGDRTTRTGNDAAPIAITLPTADTGDDRVEIETDGEISEFALSPNDKDVAFVVRGDVFVTSLDFSTTRRITDTPGLERNLAFTPDGRGLLYAAEREAQWAIFESRLADEDERFFYAATRIDETRLIEGTEQDAARAAATHPLPAPDGRHVAYLDDWAEVRVFDRQRERSVVVVPADLNYSLGNDSIRYDWSPDSRFLAVDIQPSGRLFFSNVALVPVDGSEPPRDLTRSGYLDAAPQWHANGELIAWTTARYGPRQHGGHGALLDVHAQFLDQDAFDRFRQSQEERALADTDDENGDDDKPSEKPEPEPVAFQAEGAADRQARLTIHSSDLAGFALNSEASTLYYLSAFEDGYDLWVHDLREEETAKLVKLGAGRAELALTSDDKTAVVLADGTLSKIDLEADSASAEPVEIAMTGTVNAAAERRAMLHHVWQTTRDRIYDPAVLAEADWDGLYAHYRAKLDDIETSADFVEVLNEFIGELDVSHAYARLNREAAEPTGALGAELDLADINDDGIRIASVLVQGPLARASDRVEAGHRIVAVDGRPVGENANLFAQLAGRVDQRIRLTLADVRDRYDVVLKPVSIDDEQAWRQEAWVESRHRLVEELSGGRLGYVYIPGMNDSAYRRVYSDLFGRHFDKEGIVIDVRDNRGGDLVDWLVQLFTGRQYMWNVPNGRLAQGEPLTEWVKPSVALTNQAAYSDGHCFVAAWQNLDISPLVGTPVAGTCTYAGWETLASGDIRAGTPRLGIKDADGDWLERKTTEPDVVVYPDPNEIADGEDGMLKKAVEVLLREIDGDG